MNILIAFDKFKHSMSAQAVCSCVEETILAQHPDWHTLKAPLSDGGEGFCQLLTEQAQGKLIECTVFGPRFNTVRAYFGIVKGDHLPPVLLKQLGLTRNNTIGILEMASALGLELLTLEERNPRFTSSYGVGQLLQHAAKAGADALLLGIGGSATNDLGLGALEALGLTLKYKTPHTHFLPDFWDDVLQIDPGTLTELPPLWIACDVKNTLLGEQGATAIYGPQKGLKLEDAEYFEKHMKDTALKLCVYFGKERSLLNTRSSGAAGGIAFALNVAYDAKLLPGFAITSQWLDLGTKIHWADLILTGEGQLDPSSLEGKGPGSILRYAEKHGKPVEFFVGCATEGIEAMIHAPLHIITPEGTTRDRALTEGVKNIQTAIKKRFK